MYNQEEIIEKAKKSYFYLRLNQVLVGIAIILIGVLASKSWSIVILLSLYFPIMFFIAFRFAVCPVCKKPLTRKVKGMIYCGYCGARLRNYDE